MTIRTLLVEDSPVALTILKRILETAADIEIVGTAQTGLEALSLIPVVQPDVICTDLHMPQMNGLELTAQIMDQHPRPILVVSASVQEEDTHHIFQLLEAGAVDVLPKPRAGLDPDSLSLQQSLIDKVKVVSGVRVFKKRRSRSAPAPLPVSTGIKMSTPCRPKILAIGASTGGPLALQTILAQLPKDFPIPIVCVQHISSGFLSGLIDWLAMQCPLAVQIADPGARPEPGKIYFPPERQHLILNDQGRFACSGATPTDSHCPSITLTFNSIARFYGRRAIGVLLTGMGRDGAEGMQAIAQAGGLTIAQDEATSVIFGMPKEAIALNAARHILPVDTIGSTLIQLLTAWEIAIRK